MGYNIMFNSLQGITKNHAKTLNVVQWYILQ
nr:MAG TPA: hypothetical protein [Caudoviricetes sp.]